MPKKKNDALTIHKRNELTRGSDRYSVDAKRAVNAIYWGLQKYPSTQKDRYMVYDFKTLRKLMCLESDNRYVDRMKVALNELMETIELNNWTNPLDGITYNWFATRFINEVHFFKNENGEWLARIEVNQTIKQLLLLESKDGNFTELELLQVNKMRTKYSMKLYEYLKSFKAFRYIDITQKHMMKLLGFKEDHETYKNYSALKRLLERQLKEIAKKTDLEQVKLVNSKVLAKEKKYRIIINPKSKRDVSQTEAKTVLENLLKQIRF